jgi:hypothetical protein
VTEQLTNLDVTYYKHKKMKKRLLFELSNSFPPEAHSYIEYTSLKELIQKSSAKEMLSTFSFIQWEKDFLDIIKNEENPLEVMEVESTRFSQIMLCKVKKNLFWKIVRVFDYIITQKFKDNMVKIFNASCTKCDYKVNSS